MKTQRELLLLTAAAFLLNGCVSSLDDAPCPCAPGYCCWGNKVCRPEKECQLRLAFVPKASNNPVFRVAYAGALQAQSDLNEDTGGPRVDVKCIGPQSLNSNDQGRAVEQAIESQPDGLIVSCIDPKVITPLINKAHDNNIPVITYDSDCAQSERLGFYGMLNEDSGRAAAGRLVDAMGKGGPKSVAILTGDASAENLSARVKGFMAEIAELNKPPNNNEVSIVKNMSCNETADDCARLIENDIVSPSLDGLFITGVWGLQNACTCDEKTGLACTCDDSQMPNWKTAARGKLKTVSYDTLPFELALLQDYKYLTALISQKYHSWGDETVKLMFGHLTQGAEVPPFVESHFDVLPTKPGPTQFSWPPGDFGSELTDICNTPTPP